MAIYTLPELQYDLSALEPHISARVLELHHDKHHAAYVTNANEALEQLEEARSMEDFTRVSALERALAFNVSGHILHSIFWRNLAPKAGGRPQGELLAAFENDFGSFDLFQEQMNEVAASIMGSGWAALVYEPLSRRLLVTRR